jgi:FKBP-type peptidyl-prolyl cis-trans isomerase FkpA
MRIAIVCALAVMPLLSSVATAAPEPKTEDQKTLYAIGLAISKNLASFNLTKAEADMIAAGLVDGVSGAKPKVSLEAYNPKIGALQQSRMAAAAVKEKKSSGAFLAKAAAEKGAVKTNSGMIYTSTKDGTGASPAATDTVKVHYTGKLTNGTVFDSSVQRGEPAQFGLNQVIPCWTEGLQKMKVGGKAQLVCPSDIAYGDGGRPPQIPGGATLVFDVELLDIVKEEKPADAK